MADTVTRKVLIGDDEVKTVTLRKVDPKELREKKKEARLAALKEAESKTAKARKTEQTEPNRTPVKETDKKANA